MSEKGRIDCYRYGFNGQEKDDEIKGAGNSVNYTYRMHDPRLGRFLSVDPLSKSFPWLSSYQFASNTPIAAIDLEGAESKIIIQEIGADGQPKIVLESDYSVSTTTKTVTSASPTTGATITSTISETIDTRGPLGCGTYKATLMGDGTYSETWVPDPGNAISPFQQSGISTERWINEDGYFHGFDARLTARLIEKASEIGLVNLGFDAAEVARDVVILQTDNPDFKGRFAAFRNDEVAAKYISTWDDCTPSAPHKSNSASCSPVIGNSDVLIKAYDGSQSSTDSVRNHIGLIRDGWFDHGVEAFGSVFDSSRNIGAENAQRVVNSTGK